MVRGVVKTFEQLYDYRAWLIGYELFAVLVKKKSGEAMGSVATVLPMALLLVFSYSVAVLFN